MIFILCGGPSKTAAASSFQQTPHLPRREEIITSCCLLVVCSSLKSHSWMLIIKFSSVRFAIYFCTTLPCLCNYGESFYSYSAEGCFLLDSRGLQFRVSKEPWLDGATKTPYLEPPRHQHKNSRFCKVTNRPPLRRTVLLL